jgi:hypothetical protein
VRLPITAGQSALLRLQLRAPIGRGGSPSTSHRNRQSNLEVITTAPGRPCEAGLANERAAVTPLPWRVSFCFASRALSQSLSTRSHGSAGSGSATAAAPSLQREGRCSRVTREGAPRNSGTIPSSEMQPMLRRRRMRGCLVTSRVEAHGGTTPPRPSRAAAADVACFPATGDRTAPALASSRVHPSQEATAAALAAWQGGSATTGAVLFCLSAIFCALRPVPGGNSLPAAVLGAYDACVRRISPSAEPLVHPSLRRLCKPAGLAAASQRLEKRAKPIIRAPTVLYCILDGGAASSFSRGDWILSPLGATAPPITQQLASPALPDTGAPRSEVGGLALYKRASPVTGHFLAYENQDLGRCRRHARM